MTIKGLATRFKQVHQSRRRKSKQTLPFCVKQWRVQGVCSEELWIRRLKEWEWWGLTRVAESTAQLKQCPQIPLRRRAGIEACCTSGRWPWAIRWASRTTCG
ncbi:hypothetical protein R1flu_025330 [Riccia fluitans]|uniref:Uncharacterized protein n=1 Tax=Riccia fluitans TaxID=41844 RepID=A0ABD1XYC8_9MARC